MSRLAVRTVARCRIFKVDLPIAFNGNTVYYLEVVDTPERPFVAKGFPRGELIVDVSADTEDEARDTARRMLKSKRIATKHWENFETVHAPAVHHRRRVYFSPPTKLDKQGHYFSLCDTLEEPWEEGDQIVRGRKRGMPPSEPIFTTVDFSQIWENCLEDIENRKRKICVTGSWTYQGGP